MSFKDLADSVLELTSNVFGTDVTYSPNGGDDVDIKGVFEQAYVDADGVVTNYSLLRINLSDLESEPAKGDTVTIETVEYRVSECQKDAHGGATLILKRV